MGTTNHIIFISNEVANGGAGRVISILANSFINRGYRVSIYSYNNRFATYPLNPRIKQIFFEAGYRSNIINKINRIRQLRGMLKQNRDAVIIAFEYFVNMQTIVAGWGLKNKIVISERNDPAQQDNRTVLKHLRAWLYSWADVLVCQTPDARAYFSKVIQAKTVVIPNPIMEGLPDRFSGERSKEIVYFGRLEKQKNLGLLIDAFARLYQEYPDYTLSLYGDGSEKEALAAYIEEKHLQAGIALYSCRPDIHKKILACSMFVSSSDYEGLSNSMIEAMALGLPCIVTDCPCGGARMIITSGENGILVPMRDVKALYEAMKYIIENPRKAAAISDNAVKVRSDLAAGKIVAEWERIL